MSSFAPSNINVIIELSTPFNKDEEKTVTRHNFNLNSFNNLLNSKPFLIQNIMNSGLATIKVAKEDIINYTANSGVSLQDTLSYIERFSFYDLVEQLQSVLNNTSIN